MTDTLSHEWVEELLPAAALEILEGAELLAVTAHLRECAACAAQLQAYREVASTLATTLPQQPLPPARSARVRARLLARAAPKVSPAVERSPEAQRPSVAVKSWSGWAVAAGLAGVLMVHHSIHRPVAYGWLGAGILTVILLAVGWYAWIQRRRVATLLQAQKEKDQNRSPETPEEDTYPIRPIR